MIVMNVCSKHKPFDGRVYDKISMCLVNYGYEVHNSSPNIQDEYTKDGIYLHGFQQSPGIIGRIGSSKNLLKLIEDVKPDCMICHEPDALWTACRYYKREKKKRTIRLIFDCHEAYEYWYTKFNRLTPFNTVNKLVDRILFSRIKGTVKRIDAVTSVNNTMTEGYKNYNKHSYFLPSLNTNKYTVSELYNSKQDDLLVYYGQFGNSRQKEMFIGVAKILKSESIKCKIAIIGGERRKENALQFTEEIKECGLEDYFEDLGWLDRDDAFDALSKYQIGIMRFDSYLMPGNYAMPNKFFEYMANGLAVLACKENIELARIINDEKCGILIDTEDSESLVKGIKWALNHKEEIQEMRHRALDASKTKYNWDNYGKLLQKIVEGKYDEI